MKFVSKAFALALLIVTAVFFQSCKKEGVGKRDEMKITVSDVIIQLPKLPYPGQSYYGDTSLYVPLDSIVQAKVKEAGTLNIRSVKMDSCRLELLDGDTSNNFSSFSSMSVTMMNTISGTPVTAASISSVSEATTNSLDLQVNNKEDLKDYSLEYYIINGNTRRETTKLLTVRATFKYSLVVVH